MRNLLILLTFFIPATAYGQFDTQAHGTVTNSMELYSGSSLTASANGTAFFFPENSRAVLVELIAVYNSGTGSTMDVKIQHSNDGSTWFDIPSAAFTQITTASDNKELHIDRNAIKLRPQGRIVVTIAGTSPDYDATVTLYTD